MAQEVNDLLVCCHISARRAAKGLAQRAGEDVDTFHDVEELMCAAAALADEANSVGVVDHDQGVVPIGEVADLVQGCERAVHREHAVGNDHSATGGGCGSQLGLEIGHVRILVTQPLGLAQANTVDQRCVVELVGDDRVLSVEQGLEDAAVGVEARREEDGRLGAEKCGDLRLERGVQGLRAADEADTGHAKAPLLQRF